MKKRLFRSSFTVPKLARRKMIGVKEGTFRVGISMIATGVILILAAPMPLIASQWNPTHSNATAWQTSLELADTAPTLLAEPNEPVAIEKVPSVYEATQAKAEGKRSASAAHPALPAPNAVTVSAATTATVASDPSACNTAVSPADKDSWVQKAASAYGIPASLLRAVWQIESGTQFCTTTRSTAGAQGPLQFMPSTWKHYATDGNGDGKANINDARDALFGAAKLLAANGAAQGDYRRAVFAYNHANWYVAKVLAMAGL